MRRTLEDFRSTYTATNHKVPPTLKGRKHFLDPAQEATLRWRGLGAVFALAALVLLVSTLFT